MKVLLHAEDPNRKILLERFNEASYVQEELISQAIQFEKDEVVKAAFTREEDYKTEVRKLKRALSDRDDEII